MTPRKRTPSLSPFIYKPYNARNYRRKCGHNTRSRHHIPAYHQSTFWHIGRDYIRLKYMSRHSPMGGNYTCDCKDSIRIGSCMLYFAPRAISGWKSLNATPLPAGKHSDGYRDHSPHSGYTLRIDSKNLGGRHATVIGMRPPELS